ncbi:hypothetical protein BC835DRAFT_1300938 [Cytidiella melzeri]|nr:hypothetical protein BC835DRAFT_1300938 [Cytidiella melzeri]
MSNCYLQLGLSHPSQVVVDNCCQVHSAICTVLPNVHIGLDVWHVLGRYNLAIVGGTKNKWRPVVFCEIREAILKSKAEKDRPAQYWPKDVQERKLHGVYEKWAKNGSVWNERCNAGMYYTLGKALTYLICIQIHTDQLAHVKKGCLQRVRADIATDGSRIEGSHKGWNSIQRAYTSGLESWLALASNFVLRRNIRTAYKLQSTAALSFVATTHGCHNLQLCNAIDHLFNALIQREASRNVKITYIPRVVQTLVDTGENFGLVRSDHAATFGGLWTIKEEFNKDQELMDVINSMIQTTLDLTFKTQPKSQDINIPPHIVSDTRQVVRPDVSSSVPSIAVNKALFPAAGGLLPAAVDAAICALNPRLIHLSPTERLFHNATDIDPRSLTIAKHGPEFFLFMKLRQAKQWASYQMNPRLYAAAAEDCNEALKKDSSTQSIHPKNPRAIMDRLAEVEATIVDRIGQKHYKGE